MRSGSLIVVASLFGLNACASAAGTAASGSSDPLGLSLNAHIAPTALEDDFNSATGTGFGIVAGYGFSPQASIFLGYDMATVSEVDDFEGADSESDLSHFDLGLEYAFDSPGRRLVPYVRAGWTMLSGGGEYCDIQCYDIETSGSGFTGGLGLRLFLVDALGIDAGLNLTVGSFTEASVDGSDVPVEESELVTARFMLGASWYPSRSGDSGGGGGGGGGPIK